MIEKLGQQIEELNKLLKTEVFRIYLLKVFCLSLLIFIGIRLYQMQVIYIETYRSYLSQSRTANLQKSMPRGLIYDRNFEVLVANEAINVITYHAPPGTTVPMMREVAANLATLIEINTQSLTERDLKDLYLLLFPDEANTLINSEEGHGLSSDQYYQLQLSRIHERQLEKLTEQDKASQIIFNNMNQGTNLTSNLIKAGATPKEIAVVSERLASLPGIDVGVDWIRAYPSVLGENSIFGRVSSYEAGLPATSASHYLAYGYQLNDRIGLSQLESYYESLLGGYKSQYYFTSETDSSTFEEIYQGQSGFELVLTLDSQLQAEVDLLLSKKLLTLKESMDTAKYLREGYVVILNPNTGEILSMNGKIMELNPKTNNYEIRDNALGTFQSAFTVGSVVKGATLLAGYESKATSIGQTRYDTPLKFVDGSQKASWRNLGTINDTMALMYSSNVYFMLQTLLMAGGSDQDTSEVNLSNLDFTVFESYRNFFSQFGLGVSTGIDLPNESLGLKDRTKTAAKLLDYTIGQADTYTTMQMAQYVGTVATKGKRFATQIVRDIYIPSNDKTNKQLFHSFSANLLNIVDLDEKYFDRVHQGFKMALQDSRGTGAKVFNGAGNYFAGKTGTAQEFARDEAGKLIKDTDGNFIRVHNITFVGYAPLENPEVAIAVILPQGELPSQANLAAQEIGRDALNIYFNIQKNQANLVTENEKENNA